MGRSLPALFSFSKVCRGYSFGSKPFFQIARVIFDTCATGVSCINDLGRREVWPLRSYTLTSAERYIESCRAIFRTNLSVVYCSTLLVCGILMGWILMSPVLGQKDILSLLNSGKLSSLMILISCL